MDRNSFVFYLNWHKILKKYSVQIRCEVYDAIIEYAASGTLPALKPQAQMAFDFIKEDIDKNLEKYESKVEVRRKAANERWNNKNNANYANASDALQNEKCMNLHYDNDNDNVDVNVSSIEDIKEKPSYEGKKKSARCEPLELIEKYLSGSLDENYTKFLNWTREHTPYIARHIAPLTEAQFRRLRDEYGAATVRVSMENLENRKDLRKKYTDLYRTMINWCKREKGGES